MNDWLLALAIQLRHGRPAVRITVIGVRGSAPREAGTAMLVCAAPALREQLQGTIGGGHLEWKAIAVARQMLAAGNGPGAWTDRYTLGASLGQCCGGAVELGFERYDGADLEWVDEALNARAQGPVSLVTVWQGFSPVPMRRLERKPALGQPPFALTREGEALCITERLDDGAMPLYLFGAGHVGTALVQVLAAMPLQVTWIDNREAQFGVRLATLPDNVTPLLSDQPEDEVDYAPAGACFLVMTHSHDLDFAIGRAILARGDFHWAGLIGSESKAASFAGRWERQGCSREAISRITCPIGLPGIASKHPGAIAVSVAAQLQQVIEQRSSAAGLARRPRRAVAQSGFAISAAPRALSMASSALPATGGIETALSLGTGAS